MRRLACSALASIAACLSVAPASAASTRTASLGLSRLDGAESCIAASELAKRVETLLGRQVFVSASTAEVAIDARFEPQRAGGFRAVIGITDQAGALLGTRELATPGGCRELDEPASLAIALMIDPEALAKPEPPPEPPPVKADPPVVPVRGPAPQPPAPVPAPVKPPPPPQEPALWADVAGGFALGIGVLPEISPGVVVSGMLEPAPLFPFEATLRLDAPLPVSAKSAEVTFYAVWGGLYACPLAHRGERGQVRGCAGLQGGLLAVDARGFDDPAEDLAPLHGQIGASVRGRADLRIVGPLGVGLAPEVTVPFVRDTFSYRRESGASVELFRPSPVAGHLDLFFSLAFP